MKSLEAPCARCRSPLEEGDLRCALCGEVVPALAEPEPAERAAVLVFRCTSCSAAARYDPSARGVRCAFCGEVMEREELVDPAEQTSRWVPFTVDVDAARAALAAWLGNSGWFRPSDLKREARVESLRPLWWVAWVFGARATVSWTADSNVGSRRSDWAPHAGRDELQLEDILVSASRGLSEEETQALAESYDLGSLRDEPAGVELEGATLEAYDVQRSQARARVLQAVDAAAAAEVVERLCPGARHRNVHVATRLRALETRRLAFPAWVLAYRYRDVLYRVVISGQDPSFVRGRMPLSVAKVVVTAAIAIAVCAVLALLVLAAS